MLSEKLLEVGRKSNPKSNISMAESASVMLDMMKKESEKGVCLKKIFYTAELVCKTLQKEGYLFFKTEKFFQNEKHR